MKIDIIADTICPWCYIGKKRFEKALLIRPQKDLEVGWRAFQLNPQMSPAGMDRRDYVGEKFGGLERSRTIHSSIEKAGVDEGINFNFKIIKRTPNTVHSHRLIRYAATHDLQTPVVTAIFEAYFLRGLDIGEKEILAEVADGVGLDRDKAIKFLNSDADTKTILAEDELARHLGVNGVPCFIINRKYAVSGAQSPEVLVQIFDLANQGDISQ